MDILNGSTLVKAFRDCDAQEGIRIGIACSSNATSKALIDSLWDEISDRDRMPGWQMGREINGGNAILKKRRKTEYSTIEIFAPLTEYDIRGRSYHYVLYEKHLKDTFIEELCWCERLSFDQFESCESEVLDEFLDSFKIL